jgi:hypothetical protein
MKTTDTPYEKYQKRLGSPVAHVMQLSITFKNISHYAKIYTKALA